MYESVRDSVLLITEELTQGEKETKIRRATTSGQVSLLTRVFGRGIDFICRDATVIANNGVHVLQTFLSEEKAEEVQIMGRTARQGQPGSYQHGAP
jgi:preprotein translocase subunit SecA